MKSEFSGVKRSYIPMQSIIRIDEVEKQGAAKISEGGDSGKIANFPLTPNLSSSASSEDWRQGSRAVTMARRGAGWPSTVLLWSALSKKFGSE